MKHLIFTILFTLLYINVNSQKNYSKEKNIPTFKEFSLQEKVDLDKFEKWMHSLFIDSLYSYKIVSKETDNIGYEHIKIQETYNGIEIANAVIHLQLKNGLICFYNGHFYNEIPQQNHINLDYLEVLNNYDKEDKFQVIINNNLISKQDVKKRRISNLKYIQSNNSNLVLCYEYELKDPITFEHFNLYLNPQNGIVEKKLQLNHFISKETEVTTVFSGKQKIITDSTKNGLYTLFDATRGQGIETLNLLNGTITTDTESIVDSTNAWNNFKNDLERIVLDVHFGATVTYDYYKNIHNRNSIDNKGYKLKNLVHYGQNFVNAFWDGTQMIFGDGDDNTKPLVSLDIIGHEITHGLTANTAKLVLENESGALNESFSDIFGVIIDYYARPNQANWTVAEEVSSMIRSLENPSINKDPDTYNGKNWKLIGGTDFGGIHSNNGVQNHWFYLLVNGGEGINDLSDTFKVAGIGMDKARQIVYRNLVYYLTPLSEYRDARICSIKSAVDLFGNCSKEVESVINAWYAVGVGEKYMPKISSKFNVSSYSSSDSLTIFTTNLSQNATAYFWDFGDSTTSQEFEPIHTYSKPGNYIIKLKTMGDSLCGLSDSIYLSKPITINKSINIQTIKDTSICSFPFTYKVTNQVDGNINWYGISNNYLNTGANFTFNNQNDSLVYFEDNHFRIGIKSSSKNTSSLNTNTRHTIFDVYSPILLESVEVTSNSDGIRIIELRDNKGNVLQTKSVNITKGTSRVFINFRIDPGINYQLGLGNAMIGLTRSGIGSGVKYPYTINNVISIKRSNAQNASYDYFYFFYDWDIKLITNEKKKNFIRINPKPFSVVTPTLSLKNDTIFSSLIDTNKVDFKWYNCTNKNIIDSININFFIPKNFENYGVIISSKSCYYKDTSNCISKTNTIPLLGSSEIILSPNPANDFISVNLIPEGNTKYRITDLQGKVIIKENLSENNIKISNLIPGVYLIEIQSGNNTYQTKFIKL